MARCSLFIALVTPSSAVVRLDLRWSTFRAYFFFSFKKKNDYAKHRSRATIHIQRDSISWIVWSVFLYFLFFYSFGMFGCEIVVFPIGIANNRNSIHKQPPNSLFNVISPAVFSRERLVKRSRKRKCRSLLKKHEEKNKTTNGKM